MLFIATTLIIFILGFVSQALLYARRERKLLNELTRMRRDKFDRDLADVKKNIRDDINSMPLDELVKRK